MKQFCKYNTLAFFFYNRFTLQKMFLFYEHQVNCGSKQSIAGITGNRASPQNPVVRLVAKVISYVFHPLFVPVYIAWFLITVQPYLFASFTPAEKLLAIVRFFIMYSFFPLVTVLLAKGLGFLDSIYLKTQKERIIPYIACGVYYFWMCYVLRNQPQFSKEVVQLSMAIFIASSLGLMVNIIMKVSMHAISMGILLVFMSLLAFTQAGKLWSLYVYCIFNSRPCVYIPFYCF